MGRLSRNSNDAKNSPINCREIGVNYWSNSHFITENINKNRIKRNYILVSGQSEGLKIKFMQRLYYSGKFQMFYQKAAIWGRWCLNLVFSDFMHHCVSHLSGSVLAVVKFWNCQSHITCEVFNFQTQSYCKMTKTCLTNILLYGNISTAVQIQAATK